MILADERATEALGKRLAGQLKAGDVVLIRTGLMKHYADADAYMREPPGLSLDAARFLVEEAGAMAVGADNLSFETFPSEVPGNYVPVHTYLLAQQGTPMDALGRDRFPARSPIRTYARTPSRRLHPCRTRSCR